MSLLPNLDQMTDNEKLAVLESIQKSIAESKEIQKKKIGENVDLVVQALKKIESDIRDRFDSVGNTIEKRVASIQDGRDGTNGKDGRDGKDGKSGRDGAKGDKGDSGQNGRDGVDGVDGISVVNANIDFDGSLIISLSDGREINVGEVVSADIAEKIKVINTMSTNGAIAVKEEGTTITTGVKSINFVGTGITATTSGDDVTVTVASGSGTVTSVSALTLGTSGTDLSSTVANSTTTPVITLNVPTASATNRGALSSADWTTFNNKGSGTVTSVTGTSPVSSTGGATPTISLAASYGDTQNPYASKTANFVLAAPNGSAGVPTFRAIVASDIPTLNQNTTGSAATLTTPRAIYGNNFDGSAALTQIIASTYGGTGNGFTKFTGATTAERTYTLPDASSTIVVQGGALGTPSSGTVTNLTGTASININGTVGATTASSGAFTTLSATGVTTVQAGTAALPAITTSGDTNTGIFFPAADTIAFAEGGAEAMRITSAGDVGIGTSSPATNGATFATLSLNGSNGGALHFMTAGSTIMQFYNDANALFFNASSGKATIFQIASLEKMRLDTSGNLLVGVTSANANGGVLQLKSGITFPATQVAATDANTLDDYEEGTWTPTDGSGAGLSFTVTGAQYVKVGQMVTATAVFSYPVTASTAQCTINGLPFNTNLNNSTGSVLSANAGAQKIIINSGTSFLLFPVNSTGQSTNVTLSSASVFVSLTYRATA